MNNVLKRYMTFIKYIISAGLSFAVDITLFNLLKRTLDVFIGDLSIIIGTVIARIISSLVNYLLNKNKVFGQKNGKAIDKDTLIKYYILVLIQMIISAFSVWLIHNVININATIIKVFVDILIFIVNYIVQKKYIFKK